MKNWKSHFVFNKGERNGIFLLVLVIVGLQIFFYFRSAQTEAPVDFFENEKEAARVQQQIDSLKRIALEAQKPKIYPFNPNYLTDYRGYILGMSTEEIDRLLQYRKQNKWINSAEDFQKVTGISDSLFLKIQPYLKLSSFSKTKKVNSAEAPLSKAEKTVKQDLNTASVQDLEQINGIGAVLAQRIVSYRNKIGGFIDVIQLKDVYGLKPETIQEITRFFKIEKESNHLKLNVNNASVLELSKIPYFDYELARKIVNFRQLHEKIAALEDLTKISSFPSEKLDRIKLYLSVD